MEAARRAETADRDEIVALAEMGVRELAPTRGGPLWQLREARAQPVGSSIDHDLADPDAAVVVGTIDEVVVGYGVVRTEELRGGERLAIVDDIYVEPEARGVGVGEAMMDTILEWCTVRGCVGVDAMALPGNRATKNFFERFGLTARAIVVHRSLRPDVPAEGRPATEEDR